jgi:hypothetical protein
MDFSKYKIGVVTRSINHSLYRLSQSTIDLPFKSVRLQDTSANGYLYELLNMDLDYIINIDEDAFVFNNQRLLQLLEYCIINDIDACGFPDGGVLPIRTHNPLVLNPFFNIFNIKKLKKDFSFDKMKEYVVHRKEYEESYSQ